MTLLAPLVVVAVLAAQPPQVARVQVSPNSTKFLRFDWDGKDAQGTDHQVPVYRILIRYTNPILPASKQTVTIDWLTEIEPTNLPKIPLRDALAGIPAGDWDCQVALEDVAGQVSEFSEITDQTRFTNSVNPPARPQNVGVVDE